MNFFDELKQKAEKDQLRAIKLEIILKAIENDTVIKNILKVYLNE